MTTKNVVFIDSRVAGYETLIASLGADTEWYLLSAEGDGVAQMSSILVNYSALDSIQVISHGSAGTLYLGSTVLNSGNLYSYESQLQAIGASLSETGDILLYGCNVAQGDLGLELVNSLAGITGADVAASNDLTGVATAGGDWSLEVQTSSIETLAITPLEYAGTLGVSQLEYALLAANIYGTSDLVRSDQNTLQLPTGWTQLTGSNYLVNDSTGSGFMGGVYTNGNEVVISFAGTTDENSNDWFTGNIPAATGIVLSEQVKQAALLYLHVLNDPLYAGKNITFTGHSLGGGLASLMAVFFDRPANVFDEAFFSKSADSSPTVNAFKDYIQAACTQYGYEIPEAVTSYVPGGEPTSDGVEPSATRLEREINVSNTIVKGEVLSLLNAYFLDHAGDLLGALAGSILTSISGAAIGLVAADILRIIGNGIGKIGSTTEIDTNATLDSDLNWGWNIGPLGLPNAVDLHSITLLAGLLMSPEFLATLQTHPELLPGIFANPDHLNTPVSNTPNLLELLVQREYAGEGTLAQLSSDIGKINITDGLTAQKELSPFHDGVDIAAILARVALSGIFEQVASYSPEMPSHGLVDQVFTETSSGLSFDMRGFGSEAAKLEDDLQSLLTLAIYNLPDTVFYGLSEAVWSIQAGTSAVNYTAQGDSADVVLGWTGNDSMVGGGETDLLSGYTGSDTIYGGAGDDLIFVGDGDDFLYGGAGSDSYYLSRVDYDPLISINIPTYTISDYEGWSDVLYIVDIAAATDLETIDDLNFKIDGDDLWIDLDIKGVIDDDDEGRIILQSQSFESHRIESLQLVNDAGEYSDYFISLSSVYLAMLSYGDSDWHQVSLSSSVGLFGLQAFDANGNLVNDYSDDTEGSASGVVVKNQHTNGHLLETSGNFEALIIPSDGWYTTNTPTGTYGSLVFSSDGTWAYQVDDTILALKQLNVGQTLLDTINLSGTIFDPYTIYDAITGVTTEHVSISSWSRSVSIIIKGNNLEDDEFLGTPSGDYLFGNTGDDKLWGLAGNDVLVGGGGNDSLFGGGGSDVLSISGHSGHDAVDGGTGTDTLNLDWSLNTSGSYIAFSAQDAEGNWKHFGNHYPTAFFNFPSSDSTTTTIDNLKAALEGSPLQYRYSMNTASYEYHGERSSVNFKDIEKTNVTGGANADLLVYQQGTKYAGSGGLDTFYADLSSWSESITWTNTVNFGDSARSNELEVKLGAAHQVSVSGMEQLLLITGSGNDTIVQNVTGTNDEFRTGAGNDTLSFANNDNGNSTADMGGGDDVINISGHSGHDAVDGGTGTDTLNLDWSLNTSGSYIAFSAQDAEGN
ncbi:MAG: DUF4347 domain-containing protein, partial [Rhodocyclaceae bacterium]|nr:DUF4347 domain-containing protein [Rhodocyclaceae bacterium]